MRGQRAAPRRCLRLGRLMEPYIECLHCWHPQRSCICVQSAPKSPSRHPSGSRPTAALSPGGCASTVKTTTFALSLLLFFSQSRTKTKEMKELCLEHKLWHSSSSCRRAPCGATTTAYEGTQEVTWAERRAERRCGPMIARCRCSSRRSWPQLAAQMRRLVAPA